MRLLKLLLVLFMCIAAGSAVAGPLENGIAAYNKGDYEKALRLLRSLADQGNARAQNYLGVMYEDGKGVRQDYAVAISLFTDAAEQGDHMAQNNLGTIYELGKGAPQDYAAAMTWYRKAAEQGDALAQFALGGMYADAKGVPQDYVQAHMWLSLAAVGFKILDKKRQDLTIKDRDALAAKMTPVQIAEAQRLMREWKPKSQREAVRR